MPVPTGSPAPDFEVTDLQNRRIHLSASLDAPVVLYFFNRNCTWCRSITPKIAGAFRRQREVNVHTLAIATDGTDSEVETFAREHELDMSTAVDAGGNIAESYQIERVPSVVFIDRKGEVAATYQGSAEQLPAMIEVAILALARGEQLPTFPLIGNGCAPR